MVTVVCVLKSGGEYTPEYVYRLEQGVKKHTSTPHRFVCLTDLQDLKCETIPLKHDWPGWWSKLELLYLPGPCVYFDLDTVINGNIDDILTYPHTFTALSNLDGTGRLASGCMAWNGDYSYIPNSFKPEHLAEYVTPRKWGDQGFIADHLQIVAERFQDLWPGVFSSYKWATPEQRAKAAVVVYHGLPRPHQTGWKV